MLYLWKERRWFSIFFIPIIPLSSGGYRLTCEICGAGYELSRHDYKTAKDLVTATEAWLRDEISTEEYDAKISQWEMQAYIIDHESKSIGEIEDKMPSYDQNEETIQTEDKQMCGDCGFVLDTKHRYCYECGANLFEQSDSTDQPTVEQS
jgi:hypothetical protein